MHYNLKIMVMGDKAERTNSTNETQHSHTFNIEPWEPYVEERGNNDNEIYHIPALAEIGALIGCEAKSDGLDKHFKCEDNREEIIEVTTDTVVGMRGGLI